MIRSHIRYQNVIKNPCEHARGHHQAPMITVCEVIKPHTSDQITVRKCTGMLTIPDHLFIERGGTFCLRTV